MSKIAFATLAHTRAGMRNSHVEVDNRSNFGVLKREFSQVVVKPHLTLPILSQDSLGFFFWRSTKISSQSSRKKTRAFYSWNLTQFDCTWFLLLYELIVRSNLSSLISSHLQRQYHIFIDFISSNLIFSDLTKCRFFMVPCCMISFPPMDAKSCRIHQEAATHDPQKGS